MTIAIIAILIVLISMGITKILDDKAEVLSVNELGKFANSHDLFSLRKTYSFKQLEINIDEITKLRGETIVIASRAYRDESGQFRVDNTKLALSSIGKVKPYKDYQLLPNRVIMHKYDFDYFYTKSEEIDEEHSSKKIIYTSDKIFYIAHIKEILKLMEIDPETTTIYFKTSDERFYARQLIDINKLYVARFANPSKTSIGKYKYRLIDRSTIEHNTEFTIDYSIKSSKNRKKKKNNKVSLNQINYSFIESMKQTYLKVIHKLKTTTLRSMFKQSEQTKNQDE